MAARICIEELILRQTEPCSQERSLRSFVLVPVWPRISCALVLPSVIPRALCVLGAASYLSSQYPTSSPTFPWGGSISSLPCYTHLLYTVSLRELPGNPLTCALCLVNTQVSSCSCVSFALSPLLQHLLYTQSFFIVMAVEGVFQGPSHLCSRNLFYAQAPCNLPLACERSTAAHSTGGTVYASFDPNAKRRKAGVRNTTVGPRKQCLSTRHENNKQGALHMCSPLKNSYIVYYNGTALFTHLQPVYTPPSSPACRVGQLTTTAATNATAAYKHHTTHSESRIRVPHPVLMCCRNASIAHCALV